MKRKAPLRIAITGPESTGKTALAQALADHFQTVWAPEYARHYLEKLGRPYRFEDLEPIARGQIQLEDDLAKQADRFLFCDTDMLVMKIWSEFKFGKCAPFITETLRERPYDLFVLCGTDIPWEYDPLRENPGERETLYHIYRQELSLLKAPFLEVTGNLLERLERVADFLQTLFICK